MTDLERQFRTIQLQYFPRWKEGADWTVHQGPRGSWINHAGNVQVTSEAGYCDRNNRIIWVTTPPERQPITIIHECCHALTTDMHGEAFFARIRKASARAQQLGSYEIAEALVSEAAQMEMAPPDLTASDVYGLVRIWLIEGESVAFDAIVDRLAEETLLMSQEVLHKYPRLRRVYDRECRWLDQAEALRQRVL